MVKRVFSRQARTIFYSLFCSFVILLSPGKTSIAQPEIIGSRVYGFLHSLSYQHPIQFNQLPLDRNEIAEALVMLQEKARNGEIRLSENERTELRRYISSYEIEIIELRDRSWIENLEPYTSKLHSFFSSIPILDRLMQDRRDQVWLYSKKYRDHTWLFLNPVLAFQADRGDEGEFGFRRWWGIHLQASVHRWLKAHLHWQDVAEWGHDPYVWNDRDALIDDRTGFVNFNSENTLAYENLSGGITFRSTNGTFLMFLGRDQVQWGSGRMGNLMLSGEAPPFPHFRLKVRFHETVHFSFIAGDLEPYPELRDTLYTPPSGWERSLRREKHIAAHRLDIIPLSWLQIGLQEAVIYGERGFDLSYLNPVSVYFSEEHDNGDQDNMLLGLDLLIRPARGYKVWTEILLDDFRFGKLGSDFYGNKAGLISGVSMVLPGGLLPEEIGFEYSALRPFTYSHIYPINAFKHWDSPLGVQLEPNSDRSSLWMHWWPVTWLQAGLELHYLRHGANYISEQNGELINVGGDINLPHVRGADESAPFLAGNREDDLRCYAWVDIELMENTSFLLASGIQNSSPDGETDLYFSTGIRWNLQRYREWTLRRR